MKSIFILVFSFFIGLQLKASANELVDGQKNYSIKLATADLKKGKIKFLIRGGIVSTHVKGQEAFEKRYSIKYYDFGCVMPSDISIEDYNKIVARYMDKKFGLGWRKEVRKDIQGI
jgi:hypothetical protein